jgi:hypothetical protein
MNNGLWLPFALTLKALSKAAQQPMPVIGFREYAEDV